MFGRAARRRHVQARAGLDAGWCWRVDSVNLMAERLRFIKG
jgi:hypothetical protein